MRHRSASSAIAYGALLLLPLLLAVEYRFRVGAVSFMPGEFCLLPALLAASLQRHSWNPARPSSGLLLLGMGIAATGFISVFFQSDLNHTLSAYRDLMVPVIFYFAFTSARLPSWQAIRMAKVFVACASLSSVLAIVQFRADDFLWFQDTDYVPWQEFKTTLISSSNFGQLLGVQHTLPTGTYAQTNNFAEYLVVPAVVALALSRRAACPGLQRWFWRMCAVLQATAMLFTFSRGSLLTLIAAFAGFHFLIARRRGTRIAMVLAAAGGIAFALLHSDALSFDDYGTLFSRMDMIRSGLSLIATHPTALLTGGLTEVYLNLFLFGQLVHNLFLYLVLQFGLGTMVAWTALVSLALRRAAAIWKSSVPEASSIGGAVIVAVSLSVFVYAQTTFMITSVQSAMWLFFWIGIAQHLAAGMTPAKRFERPSEPAAAAAPAGNWMPLGEPASS